MRAISQLPVLEDLAASIVLLNMQSGCDGKVRGFPRGTVAHIRFGARGATMETRGREGEDGYIRRAARVGYVVRG
jgi:hypothetical protein